MLTALAFGYIGGFTQFAKRGGTYDLKQELRRERRDNEALRELLYAQRNTAGNHPAGKALAAVTAERQHLSLVKSESSR